MSLNQRSWMKFLSRFIPDHTEPVQILVDYFSTPAGQKTLLGQICWLNQVLRGCWGDILLELVSQPELLSEIKLGAIKEVLYLMPPGYAKQAPSQAKHHTVIAAHFDLWPLPDDSIPLVILHHGLEITSNKHQMLREAARVLIPGGHLLVLGFNPWSFSGSIGALRGRSNRLPGLNRMMSPYRLLDWLRLLDFDVGTMPLPFVFFQSRKKLISSVHHVDGWYGILARKKSISITPDRQKWRPVPVFIPNSVAQKKMVSE